MAEQPISLNGADGVRPGAPNANAEGGDPVGEAVAISGPRIALAKCTRPPNGALQGQGVPVPRTAYLARAARRVLVIPAAQAQSERMFATAGLTVNKRRGST